MKELIIVATITAHEGSELPVRAALDHIVPFSRAEAGCLRYDLHQDLAKPASFVMLEAWRDEAALTSHEATPHFQQLVKTIGGLAEIRVVKLNQLL